MMRRSLLITTIVLLSVFLCCCIQPPRAPVPQTPSTNNDLTINEYVATFSWDGSLKETFVYNVKNSGSYRMLYRSFGIPLVTKPINQPHFLITTISPPATGTAYVKEYDGTVTILDGGGDATLAGTIAKLANTNEAGAYNRNYFSSGIYTAKYTFKVNIPIEYDENWSHVNIALATNHIPYQKLTIILPSAYVEDVHWYPIHLKKSVDGDRIVLTGRADEDEVVGFELLFSKDIMGQMGGFPRYEEDVKGKFERAYHS